MLKPLFYDRWTRKEATANSLPPIDLFGLKRTNRKIGHRKHFLVFIMTLQQA